MRMGLGLSIYTGRSPSVFAPSDVSGLVAWWDTATLSTLYQDSGRTTLVSANADPIGSITDRSGNSNHLLQTTSGKRPTYVTSGISSVASAQFDGTDDFLETSTSLGLASCTILMAAKCTTAGGFKGVFRWAPTAADTGTNGMIWYNNGNTALTQPGAGTYLVFLTTPANGDIFQETVQWSTTGGSRVIRRNQAALTLSTDAGYTAPTGTMPFQLGLGYTGFGNLPWNGMIGEVLVYDSVISSGNRALCEAYLKAKWSTP